jgi:hypothetical protein
MKKRTHRLRLAGGVFACQPGAFLKRKQLNAKPSITDAEPNRCGSDFNHIF